jgi:hypothetical protein
MSEHEQEFTLRGKKFRMTREKLIEAVRGQRSKPLLTWAVDIDGTWYPPKQILRAATGASKFTSHEAIQALRRFDLQAFDVTRTEAQPSVPATDTETEATPEPARDLSSVRQEALQHAIQFCSTRPDATVEDVLTAAARFEEWLNR